MKIKSWIVPMFILMFFIGIFVGWFACLDIMPNAFQEFALDVYRGKTTLEITYRDSVAVDSVVVYKMK